MPSLFPGMDPYLEDPEIFPDLHDGLIGEIRTALNSVLPPPYYAGIGSRVWMDQSHRYIGPDVPISRRQGRGSSKSERTIVVDNFRSDADVAIAPAPVVIHVPQDEFREMFIEIRSASKKRSLVTAIEILSPTNKVAGTRGRKKYRKKQAEVLGCHANLIEIDLLRGGEHTTAVPLDRLQQEAGEFDYHVCVHRANRAGDYFVYPFCLKDRLPTIAVPLLDPDPDVTLDLQTVFEQCYEHALFERHVDYEVDDPCPALSDEDAEWAKEILTKSESS